MVGTRATRPPGAPGRASRSASSSRVRARAGASAVIGAGACGRRSGTGARPPVGDGRCRGGVEHPAHLRGPDRQQPAVGDGAVERWPGPGRRTTAASAAPSAAISARWARTVSTSPRTIGPVSAASPCVERVVERGGEQRAQGAGRVVGAGGGEQLHRLGDQGDQVVGAVGEAGVVERAHLLGHPHRRAAEVGDQAARRRRAPSSPAVSAEDAARQPVEVERGAGEGHRGVQRRPGGRRRRAAGSSTARPWRPEVCTTYWPSRSAPLAAEHRDDVAAACRRGR